MKVSVSLPEDDVLFLDGYAARAGGSSRSAVIHRAIDLLRNASLEDEYAAAWDEWDASEESLVWDRTTSDGIGDAPR